MLWGFIWRRLGLPVTLWSGIRDTRCAREVDHPPSPVLQTAVPVTVCRIKENRLKSREVATENGLSVTARHEAAATDQQDPQMKEAESTQHAGSDLELM